MHPPRPKASPQRCNPVPRGASRPPRRWRDPGRVPRASACSPGSGTRGRRSAQRCGLRPRPCPNARPPTPCPGLSRRCQRSLPVAASSKCTTPDFCPATSTSVPSASVASTGEAPKSKSGPSSLGQLGPLRKPHAMLKASPLGPLEAPRHGAGLHVEGHDGVGKLGRRRRGVSRRYRRRSVRASRPRWGVVHTAAPDGPHICVPALLS